MPARGKHPYRGSWRLRDKLHSHAVHAIAQPGRRRSIVEDMTKMAETTRAVHLGTRHEKRSVSLSLHCTRQRLIEARPARAAFELRFRGEKRQIAAGTNEGTLALFFIERTAAGTFGAVLPQHHVLACIKALAPVHIGKLAIVCRFGRCHRLCLAKSSARREG